MGKWTKEQLNRLREQMTAQRRCADELAAEIRYRFGCSNLVAYRMAHGLSQPQAAARYEQATGRIMSQPLLSKLEQFPAQSSRPPQAGQIIGFAMVYATTPLRLIAPDALDQLDPYERSLLIRCNVAFTPPLAPEPAATGRPDSLEPSQSQDNTRAARGVRLADGKLEWERQVAMAARRALRFFVPRGINTLAFERPCIHARRVAPRLPVYRPAGYARSARLASAAQGRSRCVTVFLPRST